MSLSGLGRHDRALLSELRNSAEHLLVGVPEAEQPEVLDRAYYFRAMAREKEEHLGCEADRHAK